MKSTQQWTLAAAMVAFGQPQAAQAATYSLLSEPTLAAEGSVGHVSNSAAGNGTGDDARRESFAPAPPPQSISVNHINGSSAAFADLGRLSFSAALTAGTHYSAAAAGDGQFVDFLTFTGTTDRLRISFDYRVDATIAAAFADVDGFSNIPSSVYAFTSLTVEALPEAGLSGDDICFFSLGTRFCVQENQWFITSPGAIALTRSFTVEIDNGSSLMLLGQHYGAAEQRAGQDPLNDPATFDYPAASIESNFVLPRISGVGLTGVQSRGLGALLAIDGSPGGFSYAAGAVPEPASWAMLIAGFGLVGAVLRRRRAGDMTCA